MSRPVPKRTAEAGCAMAAWLGGWWGGVCCLGSSSSQFSTLHKIPVFEPLTSHPCPRGPRVTMSGSASLHGYCSCFTSEGPKSALRLRMAGRRYYIPKALSGGLSHHVPPPHLSSSPPVPPAYCPAASPCCSFVCKMGRMGTVGHERWVTAEGDGRCILI